MYEFIKGMLTEKTPTYAVIEANGIGYLLHISLHTYAQLHENEHCSLLVHMVVREDAMILFGFAGADERELFRNPRRSPRPSSRGMHPCYRASKVSARKLPSVLL
jgi:Holliday junction DNA helicase RuvA